MGHKNETNIGIVLNYLLIVVTNLSSLFLSPFFLRSFGESLNGIYILVFSFLGFFIIAEFGIGTGAVKTITVLDERNEPENRDVLYFLAQSLRARLIKELPADKKQLSTESQQLAFSGKRVIKDLARISMEIAQMAVSQEEDEQEVRRLPEWFLIELIRDLPRLAAR